MMNFDERKAKLVVSNVANYLSNKTFIVSLSSYNNIKVQITNVMGRMASDRLILVVEFTDNAQPDEETRKLQEKILYQVLSPILNDTFGVDWYNTNLWVMYDEKVKNKKPVNEEVIDTTDEKYKTSLLKKMIGYVKRTSFTLPGYFLYPDRNDHSIYLDVRPDNVIYEDKIITIWFVITPKLIRDNLDTTGVNGVCFYLENVIEHNIESELNSYFGITDIAVNVIIKNSHLSEREINIK